MFDKISVLYYLLIFDINMSEMKHPSKISNRDNLTDNSNPSFKSIFVKSKFNNRKIYGIKNKNHETEEINHLQTENSRSIHRNIKDIKEEIDNMIISQIVHWYLRNLRLKWKRQSIDDD